MKVLPFKIPKTSQESIKLQVDHQKYFYDSLHQHPEVQLTYIIKGEGRIVAGDYIGTFEPGDLFLIGANLPHVIRNDSRYYEEAYPEKAHSVSVFFEWQTLGEKFMTLPETKSIFEFSKISERGLVIKDPARMEIALLIKQLFEKTAMERLIVFLNILNILSHAQTVSPMASPGVYNKFDEMDGKRLASIYKFTMSEFHRKIQLEEVASLANMTVSSFCRYFKRRTRKSYIDFLTEIRIGQASKLLQQNDYSISQICFEVGFSNLSNFNRKFKEANGCSPTDFRKFQVASI